MRLIGNRTLKMTAVTLTTLALTVCGGDKKPAGPTDPATPEPTPTPSLGPTPEPPLSASCAKLPAGATKYSCRTEYATFQEDLNEAIDQLRAQRPGIFEGSNVRDVGAYIIGVIKNLDKKGICADYDGEELGITIDGTYNDQYDILTSKSQARNFFIGTCYPAVIPIPRGARIPPPSGCNLPSSFEVSCGEPESRFVERMLAAIDQVQKDKPELFDFSDRSPQGWPRVKDLHGYYDAIIAIFAAEGYCARFDGEEIMLKRTNEFTEHFDVNYSDKYVRKGSGIYRGACYPAAF